MHYITLKTLVPPHLSSSAAPADVATIGGDVVCAGDMAIEPEFIAVQPDDADDDGWETEEEDEDEEDGDEVENPKPFNDDEMWENLGEWARFLFRDDMKRSPFFSSNFI